MLRLTHLGDDTAYQRFSFSTQMPEGDRQTGMGFLDQETRDHTLLVACGRTYGRSGSYSAVGLSERATWRTIRSLGHDAIGG